jgi:geranylgeranylglycerol-phosphate geranylgeranyltransferase
MASQTRQRYSSGSPFEPKLGISRAVRAGRFISVSGTAPLGKDGTTVGIGDAAAQTRRCLEIIQGAVEGLGGTISDVVRTRTLLTRIEDWEKAGQVHGEFFKDVRPANTTMQVGRFIDPDCWSKSKRTRSWRTDPPRGPRMSDSRSGCTGQDISWERPPVFTKTVRGLLQLFRFELPFAAGVCVLLGEMLAAGGLPSAAQAAYGFLSIFCISATALILNDCFDVETDRINAPGRPIPSGLVTRGQAVILSSAVALLGFLFSSLISLQALAAALAVWTVGFLYNWRIKRTGLPGNLLVAISVGMTFIYGGIAVGSPWEPTVWYLAFITFCVDLGEEIAADALDVEGDRQSGSRSLAVVLGPQQALRLAGGVFAVVIAGSLIPFLFGWLAWPYLPPMLVWDAVLVYSVRRLLDPRRTGGINDIRRIYMSGLVMYLVFIVIRLAQ